MPKIVLQVNEGLGRVTPKAALQVNITTQVNSKSIRREQINGRDSWIVPSHTLPANCIMNGGLYPSEEIDAHYQTLEGTIAPLGHPSVNGQFVSAFSPEGLAGFYIGATNQNVKKSGNRVYIEKVIDVKQARGSEGGQRLLDRLEAMERGEDVPPIHTSVAAFLEQMEANDQQREMGAEWVAKIHKFDHDALLLDQVGAATPEQGIGLMVNADQATPLQANSGALVGESYREKEQRLDRAAKQRFAQGTDEYAWVADFTDTQAVIVRNGGAAEVYGYSTEGGKIVFEDTGAAVVRQESWVAMVANSFKKIFQPQARPAATKEGDMPLTPEEKAELTNDISKAVTANISQAMADAIKPVSEAVSALQANQKELSDTLTANARAEEAEKREAVAAKFGKDVADNLTGNALDALYKQCGDTTTLAGNSGHQQDGLTADIANLPKE